MNMLIKISVTAAVIAVCAGAAKAETGFYDAERVRSDSALGRRIDAELQADLAAKQREVDGIQAAAAKANPAEQAQLQQRAANTAKASSEAYAKHRREANAQLRKTLGPVVSRLKAARHLAQVLPVLPPDAPPKLDLTDDVIAGLDAADVEATAAENVRLKAELEAAKAAQKAPVTPPPK